MTQTFATSGPINIAVEQGQNGKDEQEGFRFIFMGIIQGIRNPKATSSSSKVMLNAHLNT